MKAIVHDRYGTPDVLELRDLDAPRPGDGEVLLRVHAASVNPYDWHMLTGTPYLLRLGEGLRGPKQATRGADVAGVVEAVGAGVTDLAPGDRVSGSAHGSFAELAIAAPGSLARIPESMTDAQAAAMPMAGVTALQALRDHGRVRSGQRVLVNGAAGGVGTFLVQLAVAMGAEVIAVCSTRNVDMVRELGAARVVDYVTEELMEVVEHGTVDVMVDNVGNRSISDCKRLLTPIGTYVMVSGPKDNKWLDPFARLVAGRLRFLRGGRRWVMFVADESGDELRELLGYVERGEVRSVIDRHYPLDDTAEALRYVATGHARAKVVIDVLQTDVGER